MDTVSVTQIKNRCIESMLVGATPDDFYRLYLGRLFTAFSKEWRYSDTPGVELTEEAVLSALEKRGVAHSQITLGDQFTCTKVQLQHCSITFSLYIKEVKNEPQLCLHISCENGGTTLQYVSAEDAADMILAADALFPEWESTGLPTFRTEVEKAVKKREMASLALRTILKDKLAGTGATFCIEKQLRNMQVYYRQSAVKSISATISYGKVLEHGRMLVDAVMFSQNHPEKSYYSLPNAEKLKFREYFIFEDLDWIIC